MIVMRVQVRITPTADLQQWVVCNASQKGATKNRGFVPKTGMGGADGGRGKEGKREGGREREISSFAYLDQSRS